MLAVIGIVLVFGAVLGGFLLEDGNPWLLMQPAELLIILGSAFGIVLVSNPPHVLRKMIHVILRMFRRSRHSSASYLKHLRMLYELFVYSQRGGGLMVIEDHVENPAGSEIFANHPEFLKDKVSRDFVCDSLRMMVIGVTSPHDLDLLMDLDIDVQRRGHQEPVNALSKIADALPGLGIVAAVLGVVITMEAVGGAPEIVGKRVAAALVGTFLGILLCYGLVGPLASRVEAVAETESQFLQVMRIAMVAFARGASPILAVEYARRSIPIEIRPSFVETETTIRRDAKIPQAPNPLEVRKEEGQDGNVNAA